MIRKVPALYDSAALRLPFVNEVSDLLKYRSLLRSLVARDLKVRYKRSFLGFFWAMLNPLLTMLVLATVFSQVFRFNVEHYPIYILSGILLWNFFTQATSTAMGSILNNSGVLTKIYVPPSVFVAAAVGSAAVNLLFAVVPLVIIALVMGVAPDLSWLFLIVPIVQTALFALGIGLILAAMAVFFHDTFDIYGVLLNGYFYLTPIIYPLSAVPEVLVKFQRFNPFYYFLNNLRTPILEGHLPDPTSVLLGTALPLLVVFIGWLVFTRARARFVHYL